MGKAKAFDNAAVLSQKWLDIPDDAIEFSLKKNGEEVQNGNTNDLLFTFDQLIANVSQYITLKQGDLIYTGTPEGVGPVTIGDSLEGFVGDEKMFSIKIK